MATVAVKFLPHLMRGLTISLPKVLGVATAATAVVAAPAILSTIAVPRWDHSPSYPTPPPSPPRETDKLVLEALMTQLLQEAIEKIMEDQANNASTAPKEIMCRASGPLQNHTKQVLILKSIHGWCGSFLSGIPREKASGNKNRVVHQGAPPKGSKAAVVYASDDYHWIVAWHVPFPTETNLRGKNKIYVEYGPDGPIDWDRIEKKLDASSNEKKCAGAWAKIEDGNDAAFSILFTE